MGGAPPSIVGDTPATVKKGTKNETVDAVEPELLVTRPEARGRILLEGAGAIPEVRS
jgi:hypothetical protein